MEPKQNQTNKIEIQKDVRTSPTQGKKGPTGNHHSFFQDNPSDMELGNGLLQHFSVGKVALMFEL